MRYLTMAGLIGLTLLLGSASAAAQQATLGSYQQTCGNIGMNGNTLFATCQNISYNWRGDDDRGPGGNGTWGNGNDAGQFGGPDFTATCRNIRKSGNRIDARCQKRDGGWRSTTLKNADQCGGQIINDDGRLRCGAGVSGGGNFRRFPGRFGGPGGDYVQTCRDIRNFGNRIDATCQKRDGGWRRTTLENTNQCSSSIVNDDGRLRCGR